jgi:hypothetical protein
LQFEVRGANQPRNVHEAGSKQTLLEIKACCLLHAGFLLGSLFEPDDVSDMFFRKIGNFLSDYMPPL